MQLWLCKVLANMNQILSCRVTGYFRLNPFGSVELCLHTQNLSISVQHIDLNSLKLNPFLQRHFKKQPPYRIPPIWTTFAKITPSRWTHIWNNIYIFNFFYHEMLYQLLHSNNHERKWVQTSNGQSLTYAVMIIQHPSNTECFECDQVILSCYFDFHTNY